MLKNYLKIAFRNLLKNKVYSFINIFGLAVGMAVTIMIGLWVNDELNHDNYFSNKETIAQVLEHQTLNGKTETELSIPRPLEFELKEKYNDHFKHIVMSSWTFLSYLQHKEISLSRKGNYMQEGAPDMLDLKILKGKKNGIDEPNSIMLSESTAKALFKNEDPIGKTVKLQSEDNMLVTAIYEDIPVNNSFSDLEFLSSWDYYINKHEWMKVAKKSWGNNSFQLFTQINQNDNMENISSIIKDIKKNAIKKDEAESNPQMFLSPMKDWYLRSNYEDGIQKNGRIENVWLFSIIGVFVLLLACINFINLSTASSEKRATEVGIRKSIGSKREQLIFQFLSESFLVVILAFILSIGVVLLFLNGFNTLADKEIVFPWSNFYFWLISFLFIIFTSLLAGSYPALYLKTDLLVITEMV